MDCLYMYNISIYILKHCQTFWQTVTVAAILRWFRVTRDLSGTANVPLKPSGGSIKINDILADSFIHEGE